MSGARDHGPRLVSVVAPALNEEAVLEEFHRRVRDTLEPAGIEFELVIVDDGSTDSSAELLERMTLDDPRVRVVRLSRSFGYQAAVAAGLDHARGDVVVTIDSDLQDPPELIAEMLAAWRQGSDVVYAVRRRREGEGWLKLATARWFSALFRRVAELDLPDDVGDFRLLDRRAVDVLVGMPERSRFMRGLTVWVGFTQTSIPYDREARAAGRTRYRWRTLARISLDAISSFSHVPLQIATIVGFVVSFFAFLGIPYVIVNRLLGFYVEGVSTLMFAVLLLGGIQLITLGIIGEYISRIYDEVKRRPLYVVAERHNVDPPPAGAGSEPQARAEPFSSTDS